MKRFDEWLFQVPVPNSKDAHYALVQWLRRNELGELFTEQHKAVTYVVFKDERGFNLIAKSCEPISHPDVVHNQFDIDFAQPIKIAVQLSIKKRIRPPNLLHENQSSLRQKTTVRVMTQTEKKERIDGIIAEMGFDLAHSHYELLDGIDIPILHKRQKLFILEPTMNVIVEGKVADVEKFIQAWSYGVGNKRVYGLGCVRILHDE